MRSIRISDEVWEEIAKRGKFGETEDDVLRREFGLAKQNDRRISIRPRYATHRMTTQIIELDGQYSLFVGFAHGPTERFELPSQENKLAIRKVREQAVSFAEENGASPGQVAAVKKALTSAGYHLTK